MKKTCQNCGAVLTEADGICRNCGASSRIMEQGRRKKRRILCGIVAAVAVLGIFLCGNSTSRSSGGSSNTSVKREYVEPIENYVSVFLEGDGSDKLEELAPEEYWEYQQTENGILLSAAEQEYEQEKDSIRAEGAGEYGKDFRTRCKVNRVGSVPTREQQIIREALWAQYDIAEERITAMKKLDAEITISGSEKQETIRCEPILVKIGGQWYWVNWDSCGDGYLAWFTGLE